MHRKYDILILYQSKNTKKVGDRMGMSDQQFEVYNALLTFIDELIDREQDDKEREKLKLRKKNILVNNKEVN